MIVAVHAIALNEAHHVSRWMNSIKDADMVIVGDTGSIDDTALHLQDLGATVLPTYVKPWRFDMARNAAWALIPSNVDVVIKLDLDEVLAPDWREPLEKAWTNRRLNICRFTYRFNWSFQPDGLPDVQFNADSIVSRNGWRWRSPCHETLTTSAEYETIHVPELTIDHYPDNDKSRGSYLELLTMGVTEEPNDDRLAHYYARELFYRGEWEAARKEFLRHLNLPSATWAAERAASWRFIAQMDDNPERWLLRGLAEDPGRRESWVALADHYVTTGQTAEASGAAARALRITELPVDYITDAHARDDEYLQGLL